MIFEKKKIKKICLIVRKYIEIKLLVWYTINSRLSNYVLTNFFLRKIYNWYKKGTSGEIKTQNLKKKSKISPLLLQKFLK